MWPLYERDARKAAETVSAETVLARHGAASTMSREELRAKNANPGGDEQHREPGEHGGEHAGDGPPVGVLDRPGRTPGRTASTGVGRGPSGGGEHAKVAWGKGEEMEEGNEEEDDDDVEEFIEIKNAVEQIMEVKVHQRREVQGRFLKDVARNPSKVASLHLFCPARGGTMTDQSLLLAGAVVDLRPFPRALLRQPMVPCLCARFCAPQRCACAACEWLHSGRCPCADGVCAGEVLVTGAGLCRYNPNTYQLYKIKSIVSQSFTDGPYKLSDVSSIRGIYDFLQFTVVPAVATQNMTLLDARCTADGRHQNTQCLEDPFAAEGLCCYIQQPNEGLFSSGGHSKNILVTPVKVRQQRVMPQTVKTPVGEVTRWPMLTAKTEETRDGGGTVLDQDPDGFMLDWPSTAPWFKYQTCTGEEACTRDDRLGDRKIQVSAQLPVYTQSGYIAMLEGSAETMITELSKMKKFRFLGGSTRAVFVDFTAYFPGESLYCTVSILFEIGSADVFVSPTLSVRVSDLRQATDQWVWRIVDYVVFLVALLLFVLDAYKFAKNPREFLQDLWNYISIINYVMFAYSFYLVSKLDYTLGQGPPVGIQGLTPMSDAAGSLNWVYWMMRMDKYYDVASGNCIPSWMRMIRYLEQMSPSYKQVVNTITASFNDLVTFLVLMMILVLGFAQAFNLQFGLQVREYSSLTLSINALFRTALGDFDYETLDRASPYMAGVYFLMFFFIVILMMINMILGIIIKTYDTVAAQLAIKAKTEVTGWSMLQQSVGALIKMISVRTLDELKRVSPEDNQSMSHMYVVRQDIFDREYLTEPEFRMLFADDKAALDRMGVKSVQEVCLGRMAPFTFCSHRVLLFLVTCACFRSLGAVQQAHTRTRKHIQRRQDLFHLSRPHPPTHPPIHTHTHTHTHSLTHRQPHLPLPRFFAPSFSLFAPVYRSW